MEFMNERGATKYLGVSRNSLRKHLQPVHPEQGVLYRISDLEKLKKYLEKNPVKRGRPQKVED